MAAAVPAEREEGVRAHKQEKVEEWKANDRVEGVGEEGVGEVESGEGTSKWAETREETQSGGGPNDRKEKRKRSDEETRSDGVLAKKVSVKPLSDDEPLSATEERRRMEAETGTARKTYTRLRTSPPLRPDDKDGHYVYETGDNLTSRYKVMSKLGEGTFGRVVECWDRKLKRYCAIKIIRNLRKYRHAAMIEVEVLEKLQKNDREDRHHCVRLFDWFEYRGHICMVFERLGLSLYDLMLKNHYAPFSVDDVRDFAFQLLDSVGYVHSQDLVHTDLKPENILLKALEYAKVPIPNSKHSRRIPKSTEIKLIDFGSATFSEDHHARIVSTRHYRAPEVILGLGWSFSCDLWSIGCILVELITGIVLFNTHDNLEHLAMMEKALGSIPECMSRRAGVVDGITLFKNGGHLDYPREKTSAESQLAVKKIINLHELLTKSDPSRKNDLLLLADLVTQLMCFESSKRITAHEALGHPFFEMSSGRDGVCVKNESKEGSFDKKTTPLVS